MQQRLFKYKRDPERLPSRQLTERSLSILALVERYRLLSSSLIVGLTPGNEDVTYRHLQTLYHMGLLNRFAFPRIGNPSEFWYYLDSTRALDLLAERGSDPSSLDYEGVRRNREKNYAAIMDTNQVDEMQGRLLFLKHEGMISRFHATLELACRKTAGRIVLTTWRQGAGLWDSVQAPKLSYKNNQLFELDEAEKLPHRPDAFFTLYVKDAPAGDQFRNYFYEADRKNTSTTKHNRKLRAHFHYIVKQRLHQLRYGIDRVRAVLIETLDDDWAEQLRQAAEHPGVSGNKPSPLFWFTTSRLFTEQVELREGNRTKILPKFLLSPEIIFQRIWAQPAQQQLYSLFD
jgi:hypothetical protein